MWSRFIFSIVSVLGLYLYLNTSKRGVTLDLDTEEGREVLRELAATADIVVESFAPGYLDERGLGYDALRKHEPNHILLRATRHDASWNLADVGRLSDFLARIQGNITYRRTDRVTPLAGPALLDIGRERVFGDNIDALLAEAEADLIAEATEGAEQGVLI